MVISTFLAILCILLALSDLFDFLTAFVDSFDKIAFITEPINIINFLLIITILFEFVALLKHKEKLFLGAFGVYVGLEFLASALYAVPILILQLSSGVLIIEDAKLNLFLLISIYGLTVFLFIYALFYNLSFYGFLKDKIFANKLSKYAYYVGIVIAILNVASTLILYINPGIEFTFLDCFYDLVVSLMFSIIYISCPKYLKEFFY